jgi:hypothetical protein
MEIVQLLSSCNIEADGLIDKDGKHNNRICVTVDRLCGLVVKVFGYRFRGPGSIPGATRFFLRSSGSGTGSTQPRDDN